jgi:hypothetical protein
MHFFLTKKAVLLELCFFSYRFIGLVQYLEEWRPASSMNLFSIPEDIFDRPRNPLMEVSLFLLHTGDCTWKYSSLDEKFSGQACDGLQYHRQFVYNSNYILVLMYKDKYLQVALSSYYCLSLKRSGLGKEVQAERYSLFLRCTSSV